MLNVVTCGLSGFTIFFHITSYKHDFLEKLLSMRCVPGFSPQFLSETYLILRSRWLQFCMNYEFLRDILPCSLVNTYWHLQKRTAFASLHANNSTKPNIPEDLNFRRCESLSISHWFSGMSREWRQSRLLLSRSCSDFSFEQFCTFCKYKHLEHPRRLRWTGLVQLCQSSCSIQQCDISIVKFLG
jgi:hypothetical protein